MGFASTFLKERTLFPELLKEAPDKDTGLIIVVPSCNEPGITTMLDSLAMCMEPDCKAEVIIVVNAPSDADPDYRKANLNTIININGWKNKNFKCFFRLYTIDADSSGLKDWGVGLARKTGMDEAVRRFETLNRPDGIILNLDADCTVDRNYFRVVFDELSGWKKRSACSIYFEHPLTGHEFQESVYRAIALYELHLRYYFQGLFFSGFPNVHHTVGSSVAVKALPYVKAGGMNRRMAGEDFYFIQKLVAAGGYFNLNRTTVYPSPRPSTRVPFGTGPAICRMTESDKEELMTYNVDAFHELKILFSLPDTLFVSGSISENYLYSELPKGIRLFIDREEWSSKISEIRDNTAGLKSFKKRFYDWFNMFRVVKYMNMVHSRFLERRPVIESASELLNLIGHNINSTDPIKILEYFRKLEKGS